MHARVKRLLLAICLLVPSAPPAATAQQQANQAPPSDLLMRTYYMDPRQSAEPAKNHVSC